MDAGNSAIYHHAMEMTWRSLNSLCSINQPENLLFFLLKIYLFIFLAVLGLRGCTSFSLAAEIRGYSLVVMLGLLTVEASLVVEHGP